MPGVRLISPKAVSGWGTRLSTGLAKASTRQRRSVARALTAHGLSWSSPARGSTAPLWSQVDWAAAVDTDVAPVARVVAGEVIAAVRASVPARLHWGMPDITDTLVALVVDRAIQGGPGFARRISGAGLVAAGVDLQSVLDKIANAPERYKGVEHPDAPQATVADAYQQMYKDLDRIVANSAEHMSNAATATLGETANQASEATISHIWNCAMLATSRPDHIDADGQTVAAGDTFSIGGEDAYYPGDPNLSDEQSINCLGPKVVLSGLCTALMRTWFRGEMVDLVTANDQHLSATPDHPVLTRFGWRAIGSLDPGDEVLCCTEPRAVAGSGPDVAQGETTAEEAFCAAQLSGLCSEGVAQLVVDLDAEATYGKVDVQRTDTPLSLGRYAEQLEELGKLCVPMARGQVRIASHPSAGARAAHPKDALLVLSPRDDGHVQQAHANDLATHAQSFADDLDGGEFVLIEASDSLVKVLSPVGCRGARHDADVEQAGMDDIVTDPELSGERRGRLVGEVTPDHLVTDRRSLPVPVRTPYGFRFSPVVLVSRSRYEGHVYDATTPAGLLSAGGIVAHNCLCWLEVDGIEGAVDASADEPVPDDGGAATTDDTATSEEGAAAEDDVA